MSKLEGDAEKIKKFNQQTTQCLQKENAVAVPLTISGARLNTLLEAGLIQNIQRDARREPVAFEAKAPSGKIYLFEATRVSNNVDAYAITQQGKPIDVLAPRQGEKPLTADYDLFVISPHLADLGAQDNLPVPDIAHSVFKARLKQYQAIPQPLEADYGDPAVFYQREDPELGNVSPRIRAMIPIINQALVGDGEPVVHHNADSGSPATDPQANYPLTFVLPIKLARDESCSFDEICVIQNVQELTLLIQKAKDQGYHFPLNPLWENSVRDVRRNDFIEHRAQLESWQKIMHEGVKKVAESGGG